MVPQGRGSAAKRAVLAQAHTEKPVSRNSLIFNNI